ncbi:MAG TPA: hypothetical protein HA362_03715 [Nanoarchaeota archaeon]|nr:hypothetical protein [Nanoarchaeota archaeon]
MKKIELERIVSERKDEARRRQIAQKADKLIMALGEATGFYRDEYGTDFRSPTAWEFQYQGMKIEVSLFGTSQYVSVQYRKTNVFSARYDTNRADSKRLAERLTKPSPLDAMFPPTLPVEIDCYRSGPWEARLDRYVRNPERIRESYKEERLDRLHKEWKKRDKPKKAIDPARVEATEQDFEKAMQNFGVEAKK